MCRADDTIDDETQSKQQGMESQSTPSPPPSSSNRSDSNNDVVEGTTVLQQNVKMRRTRRMKRDRDGTYSLDLSKRTSVTNANNNTKRKNSSTKKVSSKALLRHGKDAPSGGIEAFLPSFIGLAVLICAVMAQRGFRGRATVAGIDLGTTNSVICIQAPSKSVGDITCIIDPISGSNIIPSVVSFLEPNERRVGPSSKVPSKLYPHPSHVVVGHTAKRRIESHPHNTFYNAKRVLGRPYTDDAVKELKKEVEFTISGNGKEHNDDPNNKQHHPYDDVYFHVHDNDNDDILVPPQQIGSYIIHHMMQLLKDYLGHSNVNSAVLAVPAKFDTLQRQRTMEAFQNAGVKVTRVLEEPTAAALAYGLHKKDGVEKILVYDFGGGTLDISILHVSEGYCEVMGSDGDDRLGGADFDAAIANFLTQQHSHMLARLSGQDGNNSIDVEALVSSCGRINTDTSLPLCTISSFHTIAERLKIDLSQTGGETASASCLAIPAKLAEEGSDVSLESICNSMYIQELQLTLEEHITVSQPLFDRSILPVTRLLKDLNLQPSDIDEIVMVGGTTRMPQIRALVRDAFSAAQLNTHIDPDITVAYGAASVID